MRSRDHVELAALVASQAARFVRGEKPPRQHLDAYWVNSKCRHQRWHSALKAHGDRLTQSSESARKSWLGVQATIEEILITDMLTRVWGAVATAYDRRHGLGDVEPIVHNVFAAHSEANSRALSLLVYGEGTSVPEAIRLNQLRRRVERWTDLLLGTVMLDVDADEFGFDEQRVIEFFEDFQRKDAIQRQLIWQLQVGALRAAFAAHKTSSANPDLNRKIASSVIACYESELFDSTGLFKSLWLERLEITTADTQGWIDELFAL